MPFAIYNKLDQEWNNSATLIGERENNNMK